MFVYAIPPLVAALLNISLSIFIYYKNPKQDVNRIWALFLFFLFITTVGEFFARISGGDEKRALFWHNFTILGAEIATWSFFYFAFIYPRKSNIASTKSGRISIAVLLLIGIGFFINAVFREFFPTSL